MNDISENNGSNENEEEYKDRNLLPFHEIRIKIDRNYILALYGSQSAHLSGLSVDKIRKQKVKVEQAINRLRHLQSILEIIIMKKREMGG